MRIDLTHAAQTWAHAHASIEALEKRVKEEIADITRQNETRVENIIFHSFTWGGGFRDGTQQFLLRPTKEGDGVRIDVARDRVVTGNLDAGPFAGKKVVMAVGEDDDE